MLSHEQARAFYDRFGARQDWQRFYEDRAIDELIAHGDFGQASSVFEFGCGTGRLAERLLREQLPQAARYLAVDASSTMIELARERLAPFGKRAEARMTDGSMTLAANPQQYDRFISAYVADLLEERDIHAMLSEARRMLVAGGLLCLVSLTHGQTGIGRLVERLWCAVHAWRPALVGGCRPIALQAFVAEPAWRIRYRNRVQRFGVASEIVVAEKVADL